MKKWVYLIVIFIVTFNLWASNQPKNITSKISSHLEEINNRQGQSKTHPSHIQEQLKIQHENEIAFWNSLIAAYDLLKSIQSTERYNFQYEAAKAYAVERTKRVTELNKWLEHENYRIYQIGLHPSFYKQWKKAHARIKLAIHQLNPGNIQTISSNSLDTQKEINLLKEARTEISLLQSKLATKNSVTNTTSQTQKVAGKESSISTKSILLLASSCCVFFLIGHFSSRKKNLATVGEVDTIVENYLPDILPALPEEAYAIKSQEMTTEVLTNIEEQCLKVMAEKNYLLDAAQIKLHPTTRSPFKSDVNVKEENVQEAINWLLKGAIAISKTAGSKLSYLDWSCHEKAGRVSLDFTLHGVECDAEALYLNALVEGDASAPAHFGRTEQALSGHTATVSLRCANKKTVISLGLDSISGQMSH